MFALRYVTHKLTLIVQLTCVGFSVHGKPYRGLLGMPLEMALSETGSHLDIFRRCHLVEISEQMFLDWHSSESSNA